MAPGPSALGVTLERYHRLLSEGLLFATGDIWLVAGEFDDPFLGGLSCSVQWAPRSVLESPARLEALSRDLAAGDPAVRRVLYRTLPNWELPPPARRSVRYVRAGDGLAGQPRPLESGYRVAPLHPDDEEFVRRLHCQALVNGHREQGRPISRRKVLTELVRTYPTLFAPDLWIRVGSQRGTPVGHLTLMRRHDELTGEAFAELFDIYVPLARHRRALQPALLADAADWAAGEGLAIFGNVVWSGPPAEHVYRQLCRSHWEPAYDVWVHDIDVDQ